MRRQVRLSSVDAPERRQMYGDDAHQFTERLTMEKIVNVAIHDIDKYGRTVAAVTLPDGLDLAP
ncbi:MAG: thermonuclease family protein [Bryobacteraceae bacterium]